MPTGKVINPSAPGNAQGELGQVQDVDGNIYPFHNTADLKKHEPVLFDFMQYHLNLYGNLVKIPIAVLELEGNTPAISKNKWSPNFKIKWDREWEIQDDIKVEELDIKAKRLTKADIKAFRGNSGGIIHFD
jgi:hypothetical protein